MAKSQSTFQKNEREKKKRQKRKGKEERKAQRKENSKAASLEDMMAYVDGNGNIRDTPPKEEDRSLEIDASQIDVSIPKSASPDLEAERRGVVKFYNENKGFGFIIPQGGSEEYFVHETSVKGVIRDNDKVRFKLEKGERGFNAVDVSKL